jgi:RHS repeat-associated protein
MNRPAHAWLEDANGQKVSENWHYYDGHSNYTDAPTLGNLTKEESWLDTGGNPSALYTYDNYGNVLTASDARGNTTTTIYEDTYHTFPKTITNTLGHTIQYTYAPKTGQILSTTDPNGQTTRNEYDVLGRLIKVFGPNDDAAHPGVWYEYDLASRPLKITTYARSEYNTNDSNKIQISYAFYDGLGRLIQTKSQAEDSTEQIVSNVVTFNSQGKVKEKYLPYYITAGTQTEAAAYSSPNYSGAKVSFLYDSLGRLIQTTTLNESGQPIHSTVTYERWTKTAIDANGSKTKYTSDAYGQLIKVEEINGPDIYTTRYAYDTQGSLISTLDDQGNAATISYDSLGRKIAMDDPDMGQWSYEYDANGNLIKQTDAKGQVLDFQYDSLNRLTCKLANSQIIVSYFYDQAAKPNCIGRLSKVVDLSGETEFFYDSLGREIKTEKTINNKLYTVNRSYDALDRLISVTYPNGKTAQYTYNSQGGIETVTTPDGSINNIDYTESDQIKLIQYSNGTQTQYAYNSNTLRLSRLQTSSSSVLQDLAYSFDNIGNVSTITDNSAQGTNTQSFQYDDLNRLVGATGQAYGSIQYAYDSLGNLVYKGALGMAYGQGAGPHAVTELTNSQTGKLTKLTYDANGNMLTKGRTQYNYDSENRLTQVETSSYGQATTITIPLSLGWNLLAIPLELSDYSIVNVLSSIAGKYDQLTRYNSATDEFESFVNDPKFNQFDTFSFGEGYLIHISQDCTLTIIGQLTNPPARGLEVGWNLIASPALEAEISTSTALNNLIQGVDYEKVAEYNGSGYTYNPTTMQPGKAYYIYALRGCVWQIPQPADEITTFAYDGDGGRVEKTVYGLGSIVDRKTIYIGSLYEEDSDGNQKCHIFLGSNRAFTITHDSILNTHNTHYYHSDHLGSSNVISDNQGNQAQLLEYRPFGLTNRQEGGYNTNYRFTGKEFDSSVALSYYGARYYDPELGRFTQPDSIVQQPSNPQTLNRYSYCNNNPVNYVDPTGQFWGAVFAVLAKVIFGAAIGATIGTAVSAATGGDIGKGAATGAISGAFFGFVGSLSYASNAFNQGLAHVWAGSASGAINSTITDQNSGISALIGGASASVAFGIGQVLPNFKGKFAFFGNLARQATIGSLVGGAVSAATGGKFSEGAKQGALTAGIGYSANCASVLILKAMLEATIVVIGGYIAWKSGQDAAKAAKDGLAVSFPWVKHGAELTDSKVYQAKSRDPLWKAPGNPGWDGWDWSFDKGQKHFKPPDNLKDKIIYGLAQVMRTLQKILNPGQ